MTFKYESVFDVWFGFVEPYGRLIGRQIHDSIVGSRVQTIVILIRIRHVLIEGMVFGFLTDNFVGPAYMYANHRVLKPNPLLISLITEP